MFAALVWACGSHAQAAPAQSAQNNKSCVGAKITPEFPTADIAITYTPRRENDALAIAQAINRQYIDNATSSGVTLIAKSKIPDWERGKILYNTIMSTEAEAVAAQKILAACGISSHGSWTPSPQNGDYLIRLAIGLD